MMKNSQRQNIVIASTHSPLSAKKYPDGVRLWTFKQASKRVPIGALLRRLRKNGVNFVLVEGGADIHAAFLGLAGSKTQVYSDEIHMVLAPKLIGNKNALGPIGGKGVSDPNRALLLEDLQLELLGSDILIKAKPVKPRLRKPKMRKGKG